MRAFLRGTLDHRVRRAATPARADRRIRVVDLARNFGTEIALTAGLDHATGDAVIPIDADRQDPPEVIEQMVELWLQGYDTVIGVRGDRSSDTRFKRWTAGMFCRVLGRLSDVPIQENAGDFRLLDARVVAALRKLPEPTRFMKGLFAWLGFRQATVYFRREPRAAGTGKRRVWRLWNFALEGIFSFSTVPLRIWTYFGFPTAFFAITYMMYIIVRTMIAGKPVPGYPSLIAITLFAAGIQLIGIGVLGEYLSRVFVEVKRRPLYLVRSTYGFAVELPQGQVRDEPSGAQPVSPADNGVFASVRR